MRFALFYEIPVPRPWDPSSEQRGLPQHDRAGRRRRAVGLGRLLDRRAPLPRGVLALLEPRGALRRHRRPHRAHPARLRRAAHARSPTTTRCAAAESVAVLDLISNGRVDVGTGRSSTRAELEGFGIDPAADPGDVAGGDRAHGRVLDRGRARLRRAVLADAAPPGAAPARARQPHPPLWGATSQRGRPPPGRRAGPRAVLVRGRRLARGGQEEDRHLPRGAARAARSRSASSSTTTRPRSR